MSTVQLGDVIAERRFSCGGKEILLRFGRPVPLGDRGDFMCPFHLVGFLGDKVRKAVGADSLQSLVLAQKMAASLLYTSQEYARGEMLWLNSKDLGIPFDDSIADLVPKK